MNQILMTENNNNSGSKTAHSSGPADIKKVMLFFACALAAFGIILVASGSYRIYTNVQAAKTKDVPSVAIAEVEKSVSIKASYSKGISKLVYYWNENNKTELVQNGRTSVQELIDIPPIGDTIYVQLVGMDGLLADYSQKFDDLSPDTGATVIDITSSADGSQIQVSATNGAGLQYLTYKLNDGQETRVDASSGKSLIINLAIDINSLPIQVGQNTLYVTAVDMAGNAADSSKAVIGQNLPVITIVRDGDVLNCTITHDVGFSKIEFNLNGKNFVYDENFAQYNADSTTFITNIPLQPGDNKITITATGLDGAAATYRGQTTL